MPLSALCTACLYRWQTLVSHSVQYNDIKSLGGHFYRDIFCMMIVSYGMIVISMPMSFIHCKHNPKSWSVRKVILVCVFLKDKINTCNQFSPQIIICLQKSGVNTNRIGNFFICQVYFPKYHLSRQVFRTV